MKDYIFEPKKATISISDFVKNGTYFVPSSVISKEINRLDFYEPQKFQEIAAKIVCIDKHTSKFNKAVYIEEGADKLLPVVMINEERGWSEFADEDDRPNVIFVDSVNIEDGEFQYVETSGETAQKCKDWCDDLNKFLYKKFGEWGNENAKAYRKVMINANMQIPKYIGKTIDIIYSGDMTVGELRQQFLQTFNAVLVVCDSNFQTIPDKLQLKIYGIEGNNKYCVVPDATWGSIMSYFYRTYNLKISMRYPNRTWAFILPGDGLNELSKMPSFWESLFWKILMKFLSKTLYDELKQ